MTAASFLDALRASRILAEDRLERVLQEAPDALVEGDALALARELIRRGLITRYQSAAIRGGKQSGLVLGNYVILDLVGKGGMGVVFKARHQRMDRVVALKVVSPRVVRDEAAISRFRREVIAAARLHHPHIVTAFDADVAKGVHFLVMEFVEGTDLFKLVDEEGPLPIARAVDLTTQACRGLEHAHAAGIVHRDIKPNNLLLDVRGVVKVLDLGLARLDTDVPEPGTQPSSAAGHVSPSPAAEAAGDETVDLLAASPEKSSSRLTGTGMILGTVDYMAPEQAEDTRRADARSDVYSIGCTLFYLLTGRPVFPGTSIAGRLRAHLFQPPPSLRMTRPEVPEALDVLFQAMLAKRPSDRPATMVEVLSRLEAIRRDLVSAPGPGSSEPTAGHAPAATGPESAARATASRVDRKPAVAAGAMAGSGTENLALLLGLNLETDEDSALTDPRSGDRQAAPGSPLLSDLRRRWIIPVTVAVPLVLLAGGVALWLSLLPRPAFPLPDRQTDDSQTSVTRPSDTGRSTLRDDGDDLGRRRLVETPVTPEPPEESVPDEHQAQTSATGPPVAKADRPNTTSPGPAPAPPRTDAAPPSPPVSASLPPPPPSPVERLTALLDQARTAAIPARITAAQDALAGFLIQNPRPSTPRHRTLWQRAKDAQAQLRRREELSRRIILGASKTELLSWVERRKAEGLRPSQIHVHNVGKDPKFTALSVPYESGVDVKWEVITGPSEVIWERWKNPDWRLVTHSAYWLEDGTVETIALVRTESDRLAPVFSESAWAGESVPRLEELLKGYQKEPTQVPYWVAVNRKDDGQVILTILGRLVSSRGWELRGPLTIEEWKGAARNAAAAGATPLALWHWPTPDPGGPRLGVVLETSEGPFVPWSSSPVQTADEFWGDYFTQHQAGFEPDWILGFAEGGQSRYVTLWFRTGRRKAP